MLTNRCTSLIVFNYFKLTSAAFNSQMAMSVFTQKFNPIDGKKEWELQDENYDYCQEVARSAYADMLHDKERNVKYYQAIKSAVEFLRQQGRQVRVLDIGTGTGLLSMMAATCGADIITACEGFLPMAQCAAKVIQDNGFESKIKVVPKRSTELTVGSGCDMEEKANLLVTEVFDTELIGEGAILTYSHALKHLVEPNCIAVPSSATVYVQVVQSSLVRRWNDLPEITNDDVNIISPCEPSSCPGSAAVHDIQLTQLQEQHFQPITIPQNVFRFDFTGKKPLKFNEVSVTKTSTISGGSCEAVFMWWELEMDHKAQILLSCAPRWAHPEPQNMQWRDHWMQAIYYLPNPICVSQNESISIISHHDEYSMQFLVQRETVECEDKENLVPDAHPNCKCGFHFAVSRSRLGMLNDPVRNKQYLSALKRVPLKGKYVLSVSDCSLLPLIAAKLGAKKVYALEPDPLCRSIVQNYVECNSLAECVEVLSKYPREVTKEDIAEPIDVLIGEPHFTTTLLPWDSLFFWYSHSSLSHIIAKSATILPCKAVIRGVAVQFEDLWKIKAPVKNVEGFNLSEFDKMIQEATLISDADVEPQPLWEYPCKALSDPFDILEFDLTQPVDTESHISKGSVTFLSHGTCNGVALWIDYQLDQEHAITTGPCVDVKPGENVTWDMYTRQGVYFMDAVAVKASKTLRYKVEFVPTAGAFHFSFEIQ